MLKRLCCYCLSTLLCLSVCATTLWADDNTPLTVKEFAAITALQAVGAEINYQRTKPGRVGEYTLYLDGNASKRITDKHLAYLIDLPELEQVDLQGTSVTDSGLVHLKPLPHVSNLNLSFTQVTDQGLVHLSGLESLWYLYLDGTNVTDAGVPHLLTLKNLRNMSLSETKVSREGSARIAKGLPHIDHDVTKLELYVDHGEKIDRIKERAPWIGMVLFLGGGVVDDSDLVQLSQIPELRTLIVCDSKVSDAGLGVLAKLNSLEYLDISDTEVHGPGLRHLHGLKQLKVIDVTGTSIRAEFLETLKHKRPNCEIRNDSVTD